MGCALDNYTSKFYIFERVYRVFIFDSEMPSITSCHSHLQNMSPGHLLLKLDFKNTFNTLRRDKMFESVKEYAPELFTLVHSAYEQPSLLFCGDHIVESAEGVQQGDPLGPLLFCLAIQPLALKLRSEFSVFYLDDGTIGGCVEDVIHDLQLVEEEAGGRGSRPCRTTVEPQKDRTHLR